MKTQWINAWELDFWWPKCKPLLHAGLETGEGETDISQLRMLISEERTFLVIAKDEDERVLAALAYNYNNLPNFRIAYIVCIGGRGVIHQVELWAHFKAVCKQHGASAIRASCKASQARLWRRLGFEAVYDVMQVKL